MTGLLWVKLPVCRCAGIGISVGAECDVLTSFTVTGDQIVFQLALGTSYLTGELLWFK